MFYDANILSYWPSHSAQLHDKKAYGGRYVLERKGFRCNFRFEISNVTSLAAGIGWCALLAYTRSVAPAGVASCDDFLNHRRLVRAAGFFRVMVIGVNLFGGGDR